jgi:hypothetical protein
MLSRQVGACCIPSIQPGRLRVTRIAAPPSGIIVGAGGQLVADHGGYVSEGHLDQRMSERAEMAAKPLVLLTANHQVMMLVVMGVHKLKQPVAGPSTRTTERLQAQLAAITASWSASPPVTSSTSERQMSASRTARVKPPHILPGPSPGQTPSSQRPLARAVAFSGRWSTVRAGIYRPDAGSRTPGTSTRLSWTDSSTTASSSRRPNCRWRAGLRVVEDMDERRITARLGEDPWGSIGPLQIGATEPWMVWPNGRQRKRMR